MSDFSFGDGFTLVNFAKFRLTNTRGIDEDIREISDRGFTELSCDIELIVVDPLLFSRLSATLLSLSHDLVTCDADQLLVGNRDWLTRLGLELFESHLDHHQTSAKEDALELAVVEAAEGEKNLDSGGDALVVASTSVLASTRLTEFWR